MTQVGESTKTTTDEKAPEYHWVQVEYTYANGQPVEGHFHATDGGGMDWFGPLNDKGQVCLSGLPSGNVEVELVPADDEPELKELRKSIKQALDGIVEAEKREAADVEAGYSQYGTVSGYGAAIGQGMWNGGVGLLSFVWDTVKTAAEIANYLNPAEKLGNLLNATYKSYQNGELTEAEWRESLLENYKDEEFKDLAELLGYDVRNLTPEKIEDIKLLITEAYEITAFIIDDSETNDIFTQFAKDYWDAQSSHEKAEFLGGGIFEIILAALLLVFTAGIGTVAQGASKIRHAAKLKNLGIHFRRLGKILKRQKLNKKVSASTDSKSKVTAKLPDEIELSTKPADGQQKKKRKDDESSKQTVTIYRVDDNSFDPRISEDGTIPTVKTRKGNERALFINVDQPRRAKEFAQVNRSGNATITAVEADASILERLRSTSVHDLHPDSASNPTAPLRVDINKAPDQFGLRTPEQIQMLRDAIDPSTVRIIDPDDL